MKNVRLVSIENVKPEVYLAKNVYDTMGRVLLAKGTCLTPGYIKRLMDLDFRSVYIEDELSQDIEIEDVIPEETRYQVSRVTRETLVNAKRGSPIPERNIRQAVDDIIEELLNCKETLVHLTEIRSLEDQVFKHSVNVCVLSVLTGLSMGYHQLKLKDLGIGALLHDIGKAKLPEEVSNPDNFDEQEYMLYQKHCEFGWEVLKNTDNMGLLSAHVAFQHHENYDGTGYPRKLSGKGIMEYAKIVRIVDFYDSLASDQPQRSRMLPHQVLEVIKENRGIWFDPDIADHFISIIAPYPVGSTVMLSNFYKAIVASVDRNNPARPIVRLITDDKGIKVDGIKYVDLGKYDTVFITEVLNDV